MLRKRLAEMMNNLLTDLVRSVTLSDMVVVGILCRCGCAVPLCADNSIGVVFVCLFFFFFHRSGSFVVLLFLDQLMRPRSVIM